MSIQYTLRIASLVFFLLAPLATAVGESIVNDSRPNVMIVLVDDMGFSDLGCYGSEIATPNIDSLAEHGLRYTQFYNSGRCWPTRASILTGYYAQQVHRDRLPEVGGGGGGKRPPWAQLIPDMLKPFGYRSYHSGKWHVDSMPVASGFDHSYYLGDQPRFFSPKRIFIDDVKQPEIKRGTDFYGTTAIADNTIAHLKDHAVNHAGSPFFYYLAFTAPHFPLHALPEDIAKYTGKYDNGWNEHRAQRWEKIQKLGMVSGPISDVELETGPPYEWPKQIAQFGPGEVARPVDWKDLSEEARKFQATKMSIHAAMIDRIDQEFGRVIEQLKQMEAFDNTLILFLSDNGASAELMIRDDGHDTTAAPGSAATHLCLGPGWSTACNTPFRKHKTWVHEGGIATPLIAHWPKRIRDHGKLRATPGHLIDFLPTIMEITNSKFKKVQIDQPDPPGRSLAASFDSDVIIQREHLWWSHENHNAIRVGDFKLVKTSKSDWELFDLGADRAETNDLAAKMPDKVIELQRHWKKKQLEFIETVKQDFPPKKRNSK